MDVYERASAPSPSTPKLKPRWVTVAALPTLKKVPSPPATATDPLLQGPRPAPPRRAVTLPLPGPLPNLPLPLPNLGALSLGAQELWRLGTGRKGMAWKELEGEEGLGEEQEVAGLDGQVVWVFGAGGVYGGQVARTLNELNPRCIAISGFPLTPPNASDVTPSLAAYSARAAVPEDAKCRSLARAVASSPRERHAKSSFYSFQYSEQNHGHEQEDPLRGWVGGGRVRFLRTRNRAEIVQASMEVARHALEVLRLREEDVPQGKGARKGKNESKDEDEELFMDDQLLPDQLLHAAVLVVEPPLPFDRHASSDDGSGSDTSSLRDRERPRHRRVRPLPAEVAWWLRNGAELAAKEILPLGLRWPERAERFADEEEVQEAQGPASVAVKHLRRLSGVIGLGGTNRKVSPTSSLSPPSSPTSPTSSSSSPPPVPSTPNRSRRRKRPSTPPPPESYDPSLALYPLHTRTRRVPAGLPPSALTLPHWDDATSSPPPGCPRPLDPFRLVLVYSRAALGPATADGLLRAVSALARPRALRLAIREHERAALSRDPARLVKGEVRFHPLEGAGRPVVVLGLAPETVQEWLGPAVRGELDAFAGRWVDEADRKGVETVLSGAEDGEEDEQEGY